MNTFKTQLFSILAGIGLATSGLNAGIGCFSDVKVGADLLFWSACAGDMHYAVKQTGDTYKTKYLCDDDWDLGFRIYAEAGTPFSDRTFALIYTNIDIDSKDSTELGNNTSLKLSNPNSFFDEIEILSVSAKWKIEYQSLDAITSFSINSGSDSCMDVRAFSGLTWVDMTQKRNDQSTAISIITPEAEREITFNRHLDVWGLGPTFGLNTSLQFWDCLKVFGLIQASLVVGSSESKDRNSVIDSGLEAVAEVKSKDHCVCFPGLHLVTGVAYEACLCNVDFALHLGWEYTQWINAPSFPWYESGATGVRSASSERNLTLQGIFVGANVTF
jgi:hypothetical protein